jgi:hypothetical protein
LAPGTNPRRKMVGGRYKPDRLFNPIPQRALAPLNLADATTNGMGGFLSACTSGVDAKEAGEN